MKKGTLLITVVLQHVSFPDDRSGKCPTSESELEAGARFAIRSVSSWQGSWFIKT